MPKLLKQLELEAREEAQSAAALGDMMGFDAEEKQAVARGWKMHCSFCATPSKHTLCNPCLANYRRQLLRKQREGVRIPKRVRVA